MGKRVSGTPRRPRNPVAKAVHTPLFRQQVVPDKRRPLPGRKEIEKELDVEQGSPVPGGREPQES